MHGWTAAGRAVATRALPALVVLGGCLLAAVAYAAKGSGEGGASGAAAEELRKPNTKPAGALPPRPLITKHPEKMSTSTTAAFAFRAVRGTPRFQCRLDGDGWKRCRPPLAFHDLAAGEHGFSVRAVSRLGRHGAATRFRWRLFEPKSFSIEPRLSGLGSLYPGAPAQALQVVLKNPNPVPIFVTDLMVAGPPLTRSGATAPPTSS